MKILVLKSEDARRQLRDPHFLQLWRDLISECPWTTVSQTVEFVSVWYEVYQSRFLPLVVCGYSSAGDLVGLLPLALSVDGKELWPAGGQQGEYHGWLASPARSDEFLSRALRELAGCVTHDRLIFRCLPPLTPIECVRRRPFWRRNCLLRLQRRPLLNLSGLEHIAESLRKKSNKSRLNRLKKFGELQFEQINSSSLNLEEFGLIASSYDLRMGAIAGVLPFHDDALKKQFYLKLLDQPGLLHMTIMRAGRFWISAHIGGCTGKKEVYLGIFAYSPFFAQYSPSKFHVFKLAEMLSQQGFSNFDLTPGGSYKERFETHSDEVYGLDVFFRPAAYWRSLVTRTVRRAISASLKSLGLPLEGLRKKLVTQSAAREFLTVLRKPIFQKTEVRIFEFKCSKRDEPRTEGVLAKDRLSDLLDYVPVDAKQTRQAFLDQMLRRIESGSHFYTRVEDGRLIHCSWRADAMSEFLVPVLDQDQRVELSPNSAVVHGWWTHPQFRDEAFSRAALVQTLRDAFSVHGNGSVFVLLCGDEKMMLGVVEALGGVHHSTVLARRLFGITWNRFEKVEPARP
jgi:CelD/BcsL family acetyltransferase involved in cellulose biosynthesis